MSLNIRETYASVFDIVPSEKYVNCNLSTGRKSREVTDTGAPKYINSSWRATFVGSKLNEAKALQPKDRIKINSGTITHEKSNKTGADGKPLYFYNVTIFDFEKVDSSGTSTAPQATGAIDSEDDLPF
jgi:hypothetical protein